MSRIGGSRDFQAVFLAKHEAYFHDCIEALLSLGQSENAFHVLERSRARSFLAMLAERDVVFTADVPEELDDSRRRSAVQYDRLQQEIADLDPKEDPEKVEALLSRMWSLRKEAEEIEDKIRRTSPRLAALRYPQPLNLPDVRRVLDPGSAFLSYSVGEEKTNLFVSSREGELQVLVIEFGRERLQDEIEQFRKLLPGARPDTVIGNAQLLSLHALGRSLYSKLIEPAAATVTKSERLLVLPDGPLHMLPWAALIRETNEDDGETDDGWQYLIEWKPIHLALSATVAAELKRSRRNRAQPSTLLAAFGDPLYADSTCQSDAGIVDLPCAEASTDFRFPPLPGTRVEVERIAELYPKNARIYLGVAATEDAAQIIARNIHHLHFATHAFFDKHIPLNSGLALTLPEKFVEGRQNGVLQAWEIIERVRLDADLVTLSACESGLGQELGREGLIGLTRAFQYAGARTVAASLWSVADETTAELMVRFYRYLRQGQPKDQALRAAQIDLIRQPIHIRDHDGNLVEKDASAPYYWAAFQLYGDWK